ncbi:MAG: hypothetical protein ACJ762_06595 [Solirubrobacteraceae bacterium]
MVQPLRARPFALAVMGAFILGLFMLHDTAIAGTYEVYSCDPNHAGGATPSWAGTQDAGFAAYSACADGNTEGTVTRSVASGGATATGFQGAFATFDAPAGTTIESIHGYFYLSRYGCNWGAGIKATSGDLGGRWVYALEPGYCGTNGITWTYWDWPINDKRVALMAICGAATCDRSGETRAAIRNVRITINDPTPPALTSPRGELWTSDGWLNGTRQVAFDASDGAGIRRNAVQVDEQTVANYSNACDDTRATPCPNLGYSIPIDTSKLGTDGSHTLTLETVDAAGNPTEVSRTIKIDNTAPAAPTGLAVVGGDGWRSANGFGVMWTNPVTDGVAPIAGAEYRLCPATGGSCLTGTRSGDTLTRVDDLQLPASGEWTMTVWLRDAAGNADPNANATAQLRFDPTAPTVGFEPPNPSDPTLVAASAVDGESSIADARIEVRRHGSNVWQTLPSTLEGGRVTARIDDEHLAAGRYDLQAWAKDAAGNERTSTELADGGAAHLRLPVRVLTRIKAGAASRALRKHGATIRTKFGHPVRLGGQLRTADGNPIAGSEVLVFSRDQRPGAPWTAVASLKTSPRGYFAYRAAKGVSRTIRFRFSGTATIRPSIRAIRILVPARSTIHADHTHLLNGEYVHLRGRVLGGVIPAGGKLVEVQVFLRGHWRTFATTRSRPGGRWRHEYRFDGTRGNQIYRMRVRLPQESTFPYAIGRSRSIALHVRGL